ncbi:MAG: phosphoglycerate dehydrogenase [Planctomycetota bacterium]
MRILIADKLDPRHFGALEGTGIEVVDRAGISAEELAEILPGFQALVVRSRTKVTAEIIARGTTLRVIGRAGTGVDNIDVKAATARGIVVMNTPGANSNAAAEHAVAMMMALARNIAPADAAMRAGNFEKSRFTGIELRDRRLAVVGLGRIGRLVAEKARGLGMKVVGYDPALGGAAAAELGFELVDLEDAVGFADVITLHVPLLPATKHLVDADLIGRMKPGVRIVNCARGGIIDEAALHEALQSGQVAGAALDVFETEPPVGSPLLEDPRVVVTPHLGASTTEAQEIVAVRVLEQIRDFLLEGDIRGAINGLAIDPTTRNEIEPFLGLARRLGRILGGIQGGVGRLTARYYGQVPTRNVRALSAFMLRGFLDHIAGDEVNELNAWDLAHERGIVMEEVTRQEHKSFRALLSFTLVAESGRKTTVAGTLFGKTGQRIVRIDDYNLDAIPEGKMLFVSNRDVPGIVGKVASELGARGVNIANLSLGRDQKDGRALSIFNLDSAPDEGLLEELRGFEGVHVVTLIDLDT